MIWGSSWTEDAGCSSFDIFPTQSIDFYGALRSRLYDEQVSQFIRTVGLEGLSTRIINSTERPPEFKSPDFGLNHLIEVGNSIVREQNRIQELRLVEEYNQGIKKRSLEPVNHPPTPQSSSPIGQSSNTGITFDVVSEINRILNQGDRIGIEYVDKRRFQTGSWNCYGTFEGNACDDFRLFLDFAPFHHPFGSTAKISYVSQDRKSVV